jgi:uncharacterized protein YecT (DUF1311 family)
MIEANRSKPPVRLFVSHHSSKLDVALHVERALSLYDVGCWIAPRDVDPGEPFDREIQTAIDGCSAVLLLFCSSSDRSRHVKRELILADSAHKAIIPLRLEAVDPKELAYHLADSQWIDWLEQRDETIKRIAGKARQFADKAQSGTTVPPPPPAPPPAPPPPAPPPPAPPVRVEKAARPTPMLGGLPVWLWVTAGSAMALLLIALAIAPSNDDAGALADTESGLDSQGSGDGQAASEGDAEASASDGLAEAQPAQKTPVQETAARQTTSRPSFDCGAATLRVEKMVCASDELAALDRQLAVSFQNAMAVAGTEAAALRQDQISWINQVNTSCADPQCIGEALHDRTKVLDAVTEMGNILGY